MSSSISLCQCRGLTDEYPESQAKCEVEDTLYGEYLCCYQQWIPCLGSVEHCSGLTGEELHMVLQEPGQKTQERFVCPLLPDVPDSKL